MNEKKIFKKNVCFCCAGEDGPGIDQGVLVQMLTVFIVSCPRETTGAANLQEPVLDCFREAWDSGNVEVDVLWNFWGIASSLYYSCLDMN